jgi:hypothetical protein
MERRALWPGQSRAMHIPTIPGLALPPPPTLRDRIHSSLTSCVVDLPPPQQLQQQYHGEGDPSSFLLGGRQKSHAQQDRQHERNRILVPAQ